MLNTPFTRLVGCKVPIQLAPMGAVGSPDLIAAVVNAGGMGMFPTALIPLPALEGMVDAARSRSDGPFGLNILIPFLDLAIIEALAPRVRLIDFYYGPPDPSLVRRVHAGGALAGWQVGSVEHAHAAADAGCDLIVVRGTEGGGRMYGRRALWPLLEEVLDAVRVPVLAAGGIGTGRGLAAALAAGAAGVRMGSRFIATVESGAHDVWKRSIIGARSEDTILTDTFSVLWPNGPEPHRVLRSAVDAAAASTAEIVGQVAVADGVFPIPRLAAVPPGRATTGEIAAMALYAGESVHAVKRTENAGDVVRQVEAQAEMLLREFGRFLQ